MNVRGTPCMICLVFVAYFIISKHYYNETDNSVIYPTLPVVWLDGEGGLHVDRAEVLNQLNGSGGAVLPTQRRDRSQIKLCPQWNLPRLYKFDIFDSVKINRELKLF